MTKEEMFNYIEEYCKQNNLCNDKNPEPLKEKLCGHGMDLLAKENFGWIWALEVQMNLFKMKFVL